MEKYVNQEVLEDEWEMEMTDSEQEEKIDITQAEKFEQEFQTLLDELKNMPNSSKDEREARYKCLMQHPEFNNFVATLMNTTCSKDIPGYDELKNRLQKSSHGALSGNDGIVSTKVHRKDPKVFMEAVKEATKWYTGKSQNGNGYTFLQSLMMYRKNIAREEGGENDFQELGFVPGTPKKTLYKVLKLVRDVEKSLVKKENWQEIEKLIKELSAKSKYPYTEEEIKLAKKIVEGFKFVERMDAEISEEDSGTTTFGDLQEKEDEGFAEVERQEWLNSFGEDFEKKFEKKWKLVTAGASKRDQEWLKVFWSRDLLVLLKLEKLDRSKDIWTDCRKAKLLETKCSSWCSSKEKCPYVTKDKEGKNKTSRNSCYVRFGEREGVTENGSKEMYQLLEKMGMPFYQKVLKNPYIEKAYSEKVEDFYDLYDVKLKPRTPTAEGEYFLFTDIVLGKAILGNAEAGSKEEKYIKKIVSKARTKYTNETKPMLRKIFMDDSWM